MARRRRGCRGPEGRRRAGVEIKTGRECGLAPQLRCRGLRCAEAFQVFLVGREVVRAAFQLANEVSDAFADSRAGAGETVGFEFAHAFAAVEFFATTGAFVKLDGGDEVFLAADDTRHAASHGPDAFASTGGTDANIEHGNRSAILAGCYSEACLSTNNCLAIDLKAVKLLHIQSYNSLRCAVSSVTSSLSYGR